MQDASRSISGTVSRRRCGEPLGGADVRRSGADRQRGTGGRCRGRSAMAHQRAAAGEYARQPRAVDHEIFSRADRRLRDHGRGARQRRSLRPAVDDGAAANGGDWRTHGAGRIARSHPTPDHGIRAAPHCGGILVGLASAIALTRAMQSMLVGVEPTDPVTYVIMSLVFFTLAVVSLDLPARRAAALTLTAALRES